MGAQRPEDGDARGDWKLHLCYEGAQHSGAQQRARSPRHEGGPQDIHTAKRVVRKEVRGYGGCLLRARHQPSRGNDKGPRNLWAHFGTLKMVEVETFLKCEEKGNVELCMNHDVKKKVETNFGPMEDILKET